MNREYRPNVQGVMMPVPTRASDLGASPDHPRSVYVAKYPEGHVYAICEDRDDAERFAARINGTCDSFALWPSGASEENA